MVKEAHSLCNSELNMLICTLVIITMKCAVDEKLGLLQIVLANKTQDGIRRPIGCKSTLVDTPNTCCLLPSSGLASHIQGPDISAHSQ